MRVGSGEWGVARRRWRLAFLFAAVGCGGESIQRFDSAGKAISERRSDPVVALPALTGLGKARPVDEGPRDPSLVAFRDTLLAIAERRDSAALHALISPTVKYSFGESQGGPAGLFAHWKKYQSMDRLWATITDVVSHGGRFVDPRWFNAPWTFNALPDSLDAFEHLIVRDSGVVVRVKPDIADPGLGTLSYDIVRAGVYRPDSVWREIRLPDRRTAYVEARHIRSSVDWRMGMRKVGNRWVIDFFVAGD